MSEQTPNPTIPTPDEIVTFMQEQIRIKSVQVELQKLNTELAVQRASELKALDFIAQMTTPPEDAVPHTLTEEDIKENPEFKEMGLKAGDEVLLQNEAEEPKKARNLKKSA